ncbi:hypothetical protein [Massilia sp. BKSP1R2A-1]|jgi:hypothetical protein|uniref:hypothetical protein n=1 Tax=Massilia sp. BKSP1R2A-1 TaxID=3422595 RepID=UPI003D33F129
MNRIRIEALDRDAAVRARGRMERRSKRRLVKHLVLRNARWRRTVVKAFAAGLAAVLAFAALA